MFFTNYDIQGSIYFRTKTFKKFKKSKAYSLGKMVYFLLHFFLSNVGLNVKNKTKTQNNPCILPNMTFRGQYIFKRKSQKKFKKAKTIAMVKKKYFFLNFSPSNVSLNVKNRQKTHNNPCFLTIMTFGGQYIFEIKSLKKLEKAKPIALVK